MSELERYRSTVNLPGGWQAHTERDVDLASYTAEQRDQFDAWVSQRWVERVPKRIAAEHRADEAAASRTGEPSGEHAQHTVAGQGIDDQAPAGPASEMPGRRRGRAR